MLSQKSFLKNLRTLAEKRKLRNWEKSLSNWKFQTEHTFRRGLQARTPGELQKRASESSKTEKQFFQQQPEGSPWIRMQAVGLEDVRTTFSQKPAGSWTWMTLASGGAWLAPLIWASSFELSSESSRFSRDSLEFTSSLRLFGLFDSTFDSTSDSILESIRSTRYGPNRWPLISWRSAKTANKAQQLLFWLHLVGWSAAFVATFSFMVTCRSKPSFVSLSIGLFSWLSDPFDCLASTELLFEYLQSFRPLHGLRPSSL